MKRILIVCALLPALVGLSLLAWGEAAPAAGTLTLTVTLAPQKTPVPKRTTTATPHLSADPFTATLTPEATFVPLPTSTPLPDGRTPTPAPASTTPYPSPETTLAPLPEKILLGTVKAQQTTLRAIPSAAGSRRGVIKQGTVLRVTETDGDWSRVESGSFSGWIETAQLALEEIPLSEAENTVLRVGSLNIHSCRGTENIRSLADTLITANLDAVGLQEVVRSDKTDWLQRLAEAAGYPYYYFSKTVKLARLKGFDFGIALMSRYPILYAETFILDGYPEDERRAAQYAVLLTENGIVHFLNTHLSSREMYIKSVNLSSLVWYVRYIGRDSLFMTGDFNCGPPRLIEFWPDVHFANMTVSTFGDGSVPKILDNVLYTGRIRVVHTEYTSLSPLTDHALVAAELLYGA